MSKFGLVVLGAHIGIHIKSEVEEILPEKILLVEPVPHNVKAIKKPASRVVVVSENLTAWCTSIPSHLISIIKRTSIL